MSIGVLSTLGGLVDLRCQLFFHLPETLFTKEHFGADKERRDAKDAAFDCGVGVVDGNFTGWQSNFVSMSKGSFEGLQWSGVNYHTGHYHGLQIAIVNYAATMKGLQLGLINIIGKGGFLPVFPFFNFSFD